MVVSKLGKGVGYYKLGLGNLVWISLPYLECTIKIEWKDYPGSFQKVTTVCTLKIMVIVLPKQP
jgi:hypothetical protein